MPRTQFLAIIAVALTIASGAEAQAGRRGGSVGPPITTDRDTNRVGINDTTPDVTLDVESTGATEVRATGGTTGTPGKVTASNSGGQSVTIEVRGSDQADGSFGKLESNTTATGLIINAGNASGVTYLRSGNAGVAQVTSSGVTLEPGKAITFADATVQSTASFSSFSGYIVNQAGRRDSIFWHAAAAAGTAKRIEAMCIGGGAGAGNTFVLQVREHDSAGALQESLCTVAQLACDCTVGTRLSVTCAGAYDATDLLVVGIDAGTTTCTTYPALNITAWVTSF